MNPGSSAKDNRIMYIPMKADVYCVDGHFGRSMGIIVVPLAVTVTRLIVEDKAHPAIERLIPSRLVLQTAPDTVWLSCSTCEMANMTPFAEIEWTQPGLCHWAPLFHDYLDRATLISPHRIAARRINLHPDELAVRHSARVETIDGQVGRIERAMVDSTDWRVTHLMLQNSRPWDRRKTAVPIFRVSRVRGVLLGASARLRTVDGSDMLACPSEG